MIPVSITSKLLRVSSVIWPWCSVSVWVEKFGFKALLTSKRYSGNFSQTCVRQVRVWTAGAGIKWALLSYWLRFSIFDAVINYNSMGKFILILNSSCSEFVKRSSRRFHLIQRQEERIQGFQGSNPDDPGPVQPYQPRNLETKKPFIINIKGLYGWLVLMARKSFSILTNWHIYSPCVGRQLKFSNEEMVEVIHILIEMNSFGYWQFEKLKVRKLISL